MKSIKSTIWTTVFIVCFSFLYHLGCSSSDNPTAPDPGNGNNNPVNQNAQTASKTSVDIYKNISSFDQIDAFIAGPDQIVELDIPEIESGQAAMKFANSVKNKSLSRLKKVPDVLNRIQSASGDSVIFDFTERDSLEGVTYRVSLIYNPEDGKGRFFVVGFDYRDSHPLSYDSTEVRADLNSTLFDDSDDVLISLENLKRYKPGQLIQEEKGRFEPDPHAPGTEPDGGILTNEIIYSNSSFISSTNARFEYHADSGGSYSKTSTFSDGKTHTEEATFDLDGKGTFKETRRDGTKIEGTFDSAEEDGVGSYSLTTTFPDGHDPVSISESGEFTFNSADSTINGTFEREVTRQDGTVEKESVTVDQTVVGDIKTTTLNVENADGSFGHIAITETPEVDQINGEWNNADETFLVFTAQSYEDGSAHLEFKLYESEVAFENQQDPIATGEFDFYPDGSGRGVVTEGEDVYDVVIHPDGSVTITKRNS